MSDHKTTIRNFFGILGSDPATAVSYMTPDYKWWIAGVGDIDGKYQDMSAAIAPHLKAPMTITVVDVILEGDKAGVEVRATADLKNGTRYANEYFLKLTFTGDKIGAIREYHNTAHAQEIFDPIMGGGH